MELKQKDMLRGFDVVRYIQCQKSEAQKKPGYRIIRALETAKNIGLKGNSALCIVCGNLTDGREIAGSGFFDTVDSIRFNTERLIEMQESVKAEGIFDFGTIVKHDAVFVDGMFEYLEGSNKQLFLDRVSGALKEGGILIMSFLTTLPKDFVKERMEYLKRLKTMPLVPLFRDHEEKRAATLEFESGLIERMVAAGWIVQDRIDYKSERNFVEVQKAFVVLRKPG